MEKPFRYHGLTGNTRHRVFDALLQRQHGKCGICGISLAELQTQGVNQPQQVLNRNVHYLLYIDHCHTTGMIRGLLCVSCNLELGWLENYGFKPMPETMRNAARDGSREIIPYPEELFNREMQNAVTWLTRYQDAVLEYMQKERWLPRKDILFHLMNVE